MEIQKDYSSTTVQWCHLTLDSSFPSILAELFLNHNSRGLGCEKAILGRRTTSEDTQKMKTNPWHCLRLRKLQGNVHLHNPALCQSVLLDEHLHHNTLWLLAGLMLLGYPQAHLYRIRAAPQIRRINSPLINLKQASDHSVHPLGTMTLYKQYRSCPKTVTDYVRSYTICSSRPAYYRFCLTAKSDIEKAVMKIIFFFYTTRLVFFAKYSTESAFVRGLG